ncbi:hypothetical protein KIL84_017114 [Mauremys mutica]|uniref:Uncharacterized protein n=1 Tax=Mauremys mutica TaxID=74926 RepID=A0A9D3X5V5_9SAUR|nr:hypothetical protein KIL84_017114 [Mauremys mutica]
MLIASLEGHFNLTFHLSENMPPTETSNNKITVFETLEEKLVFSGFFSNFVHMAELCIKSLLVFSLYNQLHCLYMFFTKQHERKNTFLIQENYLKPQGLGR